MTQEIYPIGIAALKVQIWLNSSVCTESLMETLTVQKRSWTFTSSGRLQHSSFTNHVLIRAFEDWFCAAKH